MTSSDRVLASSAGGDNRLTIPSRFCGPPGIGNGGYVAGRLAARITSPGRKPAPAPVQVTLREPPPLATTLDLQVARGGTRVTATFGGAVVAYAEPGELLADAIPPVSFDTAAASTARFAGLTKHPFPGCFVCGIDRPAPDGLALRPGRLEERPDTVASTWVPDASLASDGRIPPAMVWAALDCPGGWSADLTGRPMVLGRITACVDAVPEVGEACVVLGQFRHRSGRKTFTTSTAYDEDCRILGRAEAIWFDVDPARFATASLTRSSVGEP